MQEFVKGSFLEAAPIVPVSAKSGLGLMALKESLLKVCSTVPRERCGCFSFACRSLLYPSWLWNGSYWNVFSGTLRKEDEVEIYPAGSGPNSWPRGPFSFSRTGLRGATDGDQSDKRQKSVRYTGVWRSRCRIAFVQFRLAPQRLNCCPLRLCSWQRSSDPVPPRYSRTDGYPQTCGSRRNSARTNWICSDSTGSANPYVTRGPVHLSKALSYGNFGRRNCPGR